MKRILITGAKGYVGRALISYFINDSNYEIFAPTRDELDLTNSNAVNTFFNSNKFFDVVIHAATRGGTLGGKEFFEHPNRKNVVEENLKMFNNLINNRKKYGLLLNLGSGAELDKSKSINEKSKLENSFPLDNYGLSKNLIAKQIKLIPDSEIINLRIFGLFDENEDKRRFIKSNIIRYLMKLPMVIEENIMMDFIYMGDLITIIERIIFSSYTPKFSNAVYEEKKTLLQIASMINNLDDHKVPIHILGSIEGNDYYGEHSFFKFDLIGLNAGIIRTYNKIKENIVDINEL